MKRRLKPLDSTSGAPAELHNKGHKVWRDQALYRKFLKRHGLEHATPVAERMGGSAHPHNRRNDASMGWGVLNGITTHPGHADLNRLTAMGLYG